MAAVIPAYREANRIGGVVRRVRERLQVVHVVDDGSPDETAARAREAGAEVTVHSTNAGKGAAIKTGLRLVLEGGFDYALFLDGDGQHLPEEIDRFLEAAAASSSGLLIGNRLDNAREMPFARLVTNHLISWQISRICGQPIPDTQCGFRMIHRALMPGLFCRSNGYEYETEMLILASRAGQRIDSVPVSAVYRGEKSKIRPVRDGILFAKLLARYRNKE